MSVRAGRLRARLEVFQSTESKDEFGAITSDKVRVGRYWCEPNFKSNERVGDGILQAQTVVEFTTRYNKQLGSLNNKDMYISFQDKEWEIVSVINPRMLNEYLIIKCIQRGG